MVISSKVAFWLLAAFDAVLEEAEPSLFFGEEEFLHAEMESSSGINATTVANLSL